MRGPQPGSEKAKNAGRVFTRHLVHLETSKSHGRPPVSWFIAALVGFFAAAPALAQISPKAPSKILDQPARDQATFSLRGNGEFQEPDGAAPVSPQAWAQLVRDTCAAKEKEWRERVQELEARVKNIAQSQAVLGFPEAERRAHQKSLEEQRRTLYAQLDYLLLGKKAKRLEAPVEDYRRAAGLKRPKAETAFLRTLQLVFADALPCELEALQGTLFFAVFDIAFTRERFDASSAEGGAGLSNDRVYAYLERIYDERRRKLGSFEEVYRTLRPQEPEDGFGYVDELIAQLALPDSPHPVTAPAPGATAERLKLMQQIQSYLRLTAEPIRIQGYLYAKLEEIQGALRTSISDRTSEKLFERAEKALYCIEGALRELAGSEPAQVLGTLRNVLDEWFREDALPAVQKTLDEDPLSAYWFFVQTGTVARAPFVFEGSKVRVSRGTPDLESLKTLRLDKIFERLNRVRIPPEFIQCHQNLEKVLTEATLSNRQAFQQIAASNFSSKAKAKLTSHLGPRSGADPLSTLDAYAWVLRDANKIKGRMDWELVRAILGLLENEKRQRLQEVVKAELESHPATVRAQLAGYLGVLSEVMIELEQRQASDHRFQQRTTGGPIAWFISHLLLSGGVPVQMWAPGGVTGDEFAELMDEISPKNTDSGNLYQGKRANEMRFIHDGQDFRANLVELINTSQSWINMTGFDWKLDEGGKEIAYRLMAKKLGIEGRSFDQFLDEFREGLPRDPAAAEPTLFYDIALGRMKNLLVYFLVKRSEIPAVAEARRAVEEALGSELTCATVTTCGDLTLLDIRAGANYNKRRASEPRYQEAWEAFRKLQSLFEEKDIEVHKSRPRRYLSEYIADGHRLRNLIRRYGKKRADDPKQMQPFAINIIMDAKQDLFNTRWGDLSREFPFFFSDPYWDLYLPLLEFDAKLLPWKGFIEFPWHLGSIPLPGRKMFGFLPMPYLPYPWLRRVPGFGWAGPGLSMLLQHGLATDMRMLWAMSMHAKSISNECSAIESGMGPGTKYFNPYPDFRTWHDVGLNVKGPIVGDVNDHFVQLFNEARRNNAGVPRARGLKLPKLRYNNYLYDEAKCSGDSNLVSAAGDSNDRAWLVTTHPDRADYNYRGVFMAALAAARENIYMENVFFTDPLVTRMLRRKALEFQGRVNCDGLIEIDCQEKKRATVPIYVVLPDSTDKPSLDVVSRADLQEMLRLGIKVYRWNPSKGWSATKMMHTKAWIIDYMDGKDSLTYLGSHNATQRSLMTDNEIGIVTTSPDFAREVYENLFRHDMAQDSRQETVEGFHMGWSAKPVARSARRLRRLLVNLFWFF